MPAAVLGCSTGRFSANARFITSAVRRKLKVYLQLGAAQPTGLRDEDRPRLPDGSIPGSRMADTGSLASDAIHSYNRAYVEDLLGQYPDIAGFRPDWPEYPCYTFAEVFQDFSPHVERFAESTGFDFHGIRLEVEQFYRYLRSQNPGRRINNDDLRQLADGRGLHFFLLSRLQGSPGILEWLRLKAALSVDTLRHWRSSISEVGGDQLELGGHAFMPPYSLLTGFDFARAAEVCDTLSPKLYTMHWSQMVKFWADALLEANPALDEQLLVPALVNLVDLAEPQQAGTRLSDYGYPAPDEPHPIPSETQIRKIQQTMQEAGGAAPIHPLVHGYGPLEDFRRRLQLVVASGATGVWINRYGYLSDEKLAAIGEIWSSG